MSPATDTTAKEPQTQPRRTRLYTAIFLISLILFFSFLGYQAELVLPTRPPNLDNTYTPMTQSAPRGVGSYDVLGYTIDKTEAEQLLQTEAGRKQLSLENGAVKIDESLISLGRDAFYRETFGNEVLFTEKMGLKPRRLRRLLR